MKKIIRLWDLTSKIEEFETNVVDRAIVAYMKTIEGEEKEKQHLFDKWLYENYKVRWDTGQLCEKEDLIFEDEKLMSLFLLKFSK